MTGDATPATRRDAEEFFARYAAALLARDEGAVARLYAVPSLILFPGNAIAVGDAGQTARFFAASWEQYVGIETIEPQLTIMGEGPGCIWADVTWRYDGKALERFCYQLYAGAEGYQIAVLTPLDTPGVMIARMPSW